MTPEMPYPGLLLDGNRLRYHRGAPMHTLLFLEPGHFHAALTLRVPQARAADEVFVYAREGRSCAISSPSSSASTGARKTPRAGDPS